MIFIKFGLDYVYYTENHSFHTTGEVKNDKAPNSKPLTAVNVVFNVPAKFLNALTL